MQRFPHCPVDIDDIIDLVHRSAVRDHINVCTCVQTTAQVAPEDAIKTLQMTLPAAPLKALAPIELENVSPALLLPPARGRRTSILPACLRYIQEIRVLVSGQAVAFRQLPVVEPPRNWGRIGGVLARDQAQ